MYRGGGCFRECSSATNAHSLVGTGFGYIIACFLFLIGNCVIIMLIRSDASSHFGSDATENSEAYQNADAIAGGPDAGTPQVTAILIYTCAIWLHAI